MRAHLMSPVMNTPSQSMTLIFCCVGFVPYVLLQKAHGPEEVEAAGARALVTVRKKICQIVGAFAPLDQKLSLTYAVSNPMEFHVHALVTRTPVRAVRVQAYVRTGSRTIRSIRFIAMIPAVFTCKLTTLFP